MSKDRAYTNILVDLFHCLTVLTGKKIISYIQSELLPAKDAPHAACCPPKSHEFFPQSCLPASQSPACVVSFLPDAGLCICLYWISSGFCQPVALACVDWMVAQFSSIMIVLPHFLSFADLMRPHCNTFSRPMVLDSIRFHCITCPTQ